VLAGKMKIPTYRVKLPEWVKACIPDPETVYHTIEDRMELAIELSANNIKNNGGPFAAAVFERESGRLIAPGVNLVL
jgi:hypothetical protein